MEPLQHWRWFRKLCYFCKINNKSPGHLLQILLSIKPSYTIRNAGHNSFFKFSPIFFKNYYFWSTINEWNKLASILEMQIVTEFLKNILNFICPSRNSIFNFHNQKALKFITKLPLGLGHLRYHKCKHNFSRSKWFNFWHKPFPSAIQQPL